MATALFRQAWPSSSWPGLLNEVTGLTPVGICLCYSSLSPGKRCQGWSCSGRPQGGSTGLSLRPAHLPVTNQAELGTSFQKPEISSLPPQRMLVPSTPHQIYSLKTTVAHFSTPTSLRDRGATSHSSLATTFHIFPAPPTPQLASPPVQASHLHPPVNTSRPQILR